MNTKINPKTSAVLVIDELVTKGVDTLYNPDPEEDRVVRNSMKVVDAARAAGMPVIFSCDQHIPGLDRELKLWGEHGIKDVAVANPLLKPGASDRDFIIPKRRYSGFFQTDLDLTLRELGVTTLVAVGEDTNICVLHTLADAYFLGYETVVVEDCTRTFLCGTQEAGIEHFVKCYDSRITTADQVVAELGE
jgi:nicotinamidase-related amidase